MQSKKGVKVSDNGTYSIYVDAEYEGMKQVDVIVNVETPIQDTKTLEVKDNGTYTISPDEGYDGITSAEVEVNIPLQGIKVQKFTENGNYTVYPDTGYKAMESVDVEVIVPIETGVEQTISRNGTYVIEPSEDYYRGIENATIVVDVKGGDISHVALPHIVVMFKSDGNVEPGVEFRLEVGDHGRRRFLRLFRPDIGIHAVPSVISGNEVCTAFREKHMERHFFMRRGR
jgi:hypothetical protein